MYKTYVHKLVYIQNVYKKGQVKNGKVKRIFTESVSSFNLKLLPFRCSKRKYLVHESQYTFFKNGLTSNCL